MQQGIARFRVCTKKLIHNQRNMFTKTFTNLRTLSFAIVMVATLMVGTMTVPQAQAQSVTSEEELQTLINALLAQVAQLQARLIELRNGLTVS